MTQKTAPINWRSLVRQIHWMTAAVAFVCLTLYAVSGFLLNNEGLLASKPVTTHIEKSLSAALATELSPVKGEAELTPEVQAELSRLFAIDMRHATLRTGKGKTTISLPSPGVRTTIEVDAKAGRLIYERSDRGAVAFLTDLHKGKNVQPLWHQFINVFAISVLVFAISGFVLLLFQIKSRKWTLPLTALGLAGPVLFLLIVMHL